MKRAAQSEVSPVIIDGDLTMSVKNANQVKDVTTEEEILGSLYQIGLALASDLDLPQVLESVVHNACKVVKADSATVHTYSEERDEFYLAAAVGTSERHEQYSTPRKGGQTYQIVRQRRPIFSNNARLDPILRDSPFTQNENVNSVAGLPLIKGDEVVGVLYINYHASEQITEDSLRIVQLFANQAAVAIANAKLFQERQEGEQRLYELLYVGDEIRNSITEGLGAVLYQIVKGACRIVDADCAVIYPYDASRQEFYDIKSVVAYGLVREPFKLTDKPRRKGGMAAYVRRQEVVVLNNIAEEDPDMFKSPFIARERIKAFIGMSLQAGGVELGVLYINFREPHPFTSDEIRVVEILANQAAVAIQNARQIEALQKLREQRLAAERWATLGKAAANLAHRINNTAGLIPVVAQDLEELLADVALEEERRQEVDADLQRIERNTRFTLQMADALFKPFEDLPAEECDVNALLEESISVANVPEDVALKTEYADELPKVIASRRLADVFVELMTNAVKAMPDGGELEIGSRLGGEGWVEVWFSDTGHGIPPESQDKIFDLFFTTSEGSLGFGLWWVKTFLEQQGATIDVESELGKGTTFTVRLPVEGPQAAVE
jgi:GAF domain-containing protein